MSRRPFLIALVAIAAMLVLTPIVLLWLAGVQADGLPADPPQGTNGELPGLVAPGDEEATVWAVGFDGSAWFNVDADEYNLQAGILGDRAPRIDLAVPWDPGRAGLGIHRPPIADPASGHVVYVSDDGVTSTVHRVDVTDPDEIVELGELPEVVWDIATARDASAAYLALVGREDTEQDLGVVRLALDGSGAIAPLLPPAEARESDLRLVAVARFQVFVEISPDGGHLARTICRGVAGCHSDVVDLGSGERIDLGEGTVHHLGPGGIVILERCVQGNCRSELLDLVTGDAFPMVAEPINTTIGTAGGAPVMVTVEQVGEVPSLVATDVRTGDEFELYRGVDGGWFALSSATVEQWSVPDGWVLIVESRAEEGPGAVMREISRHVLVPLRGGQSIVVDGPALRLPDPPGIEG